MYLAGNPIILFSLLFRNGGVSLSKVFLLCIYSVKTFLSLFCGIIEMIFYSRKIENTKITEPPLFILGHYRSGTTLLQKLLICDSKYGYIKYLDVFFPISAFLCPAITRKWMQLIIRTFKMKNIFFKNVAIQI